MVRTIAPIDKGVIDSARGRQSKESESDDGTESVRARAIIGLDGRRVAGKKVLGNSSGIDQQEHKNALHPHGFTSIPTPTRLPPLVEISADDRPGLLCSVSAVFSGSGRNNDVVLIDTKDIAR
jgi:hypothetical protein